MCQALFEARYKGFAINSHNTPYESYYPHFTDEEIKAETARNFSKVMNEGGEKWSRPFVTRCIPTVGRTERLRGPAAH